ncbi:hypothetical protein JCM19239_2234 [Vibrio variabilis]|uniref:Uncharacterized protein n=1 Tax=Vibrio variabilis TaxID=990271 RepID=A0ABQ0JPC6_9VIBR|nr:hypothetical protein JCM19239_2234 [Vibrio variabilis]
MQKHGLSFWYAAAFMFGAIQLVALPILIPSHILSVSVHGSRRCGVIVRGLEWFCGTADRVND